MIINKVQKIKEQSTAKLLRTLIFSLQTLISGFVDNNRISRQIDSGFLDHPKVVHKFRLVRQTEQAFRSPYHYDLLANLFPLGVWSITTSKSTTSTKT